MKTVEIAKEFSIYPAGRSPQDGPNSGERFRKEFLEAPLRADEKICVILDGARSYGSSFLEEAFGGLVRDTGFNADFLKTHLKVVAQTGLYRAYARLAMKYIEDAAAAR